MKKNAGSPLVFLSGTIILVIGGLNIVAVLILFNFVKSIKTPPEFLIPFIQHFMNSYLKSPLQLIIPLLTIVTGVIFIIASKKMAKGEKLFNWSVVSLVLGLIILFELRGGGLFGATTAGILSSVGGIFGLIESTKKS